MDRVCLATDGACRGDPGPGAIAAAVFDDNGTEIAWNGEVIGETKNNRVEYRAVELAPRSGQFWTRDSSCGCVPPFVVKGRHLTE